MALPFSEYIKIHVTFIMYIGIVLHEAEQGISTSIV